jgi:hypothetical protein
MGVAETGLNAVLSDLDLFRSAFPEEVVRPSASFAVIAIQTAREPVALCVLEWTCPDWFEPTARRLSLNDLRWIDATHKPNDIAEFEPWSAIALEALVEQGVRKALDGEKVNCATSRIFTV